MTIPFDNSYARLPERFYSRLPPTPVRAPGLIKVNHGLARHLGLDPAYLESPEGVAVLAGNRVPAGAEPIAMAYAGHQFGGWVPQLGDGRAILLGEVVAADGRRHDIHLKGSGQTPYSRNGDGRAWIGPVLREYVVSEAMAALGIPTTRALAAVTTGERVRREEAFPGAVLARVAASHVRVGTFQFFAARGDTEALRLLADHVIDRHYPEARDAAHPYLALFDGILARQAGLIARWMSVGFIHGVMNTDNMSIAGETIDFGPCAFMDTFHPGQVFSSIDHMGRYAFANQPKIGQWNLSCLASALLPLIDENEDAAVEAAQDRLNAYGPRFDAAWTAALLAKVGLAGRRDGDADLAVALLNRMAEGKADFTLAFRRLCDLPDHADNDGAVDQSFTSLFTDPVAADAWLADWRARLAHEDRTEADRQAAMRAVNPAYIPRNHRVEEVIQAALEEDLAPFETLLAVLARPYEDQPENAAYQAPPRPEEVVRATFCGT
ncbi:MAG: YdiU family protein [Rhodobacterales bacterium]|nr:YdiU family protein [Rhodobacterales bacterium]